MKLYTEEQLHNTVKAIQNYLDCYDWYSQEMIKKHINSLIPIELPSDEEIKNEAYVQGAFVLHFTNGAKWMRDKIGGKDEQ